MRLSLIRHAQAAEVAAFADDALRPLTAQGQERFRAQVARLSKAHWSCGQLWSSPWLRAFQTAQLLQPLCAVPMQSVPGLAMEPGEFLLELLQAERELAAVGHQPWLSQLAAWLVLGSMDEASQLPLEPGDVLVLQGEVRPGGMLLVQRYPA